MTDRITSRPTALACVAALAALSGCAGLTGGQGFGNGLLPPTPVASSGHQGSYTCPGGTFFDIAYDPSNTSMRLRVNGATSHPHTLYRLVDPSGQTSYQDAEYQLIPGTDPNQLTLVPRAPAGPAMACSRTP